MMTTTKQPGTSPRFYIKAERTQAGHQILQVAATNPGSSDAAPREVAAFIDELAADLERRSELAGARWRICSDVTNACVFIALTGEDQAALAAEFAASVIASHELV